MTEAEGWSSGVRKDVGGTDIEELERPLATSFGLIASAQEATAHQFRALLDADTDVIAYVNRTVFDSRSLIDLTPALRSLRAHAVVPIRIGTRHITFHDPRLPAVVSRKTIRRFEATRSGIWGGICPLSGASTAHSTGTDRCAMKVSTRHRYPRVGGQRVGGSSESSSPPSIRFAKTRRCVSRAPQGFSHHSHPLNHRPGLGHGDVPGRLREAAVGGD